MKEKILTLADIAIGKEVVFVSIAGGKTSKRRLADMGLNEGVRFKVLQSHKGGPCVIMVGSIRLALGFKMAQKVLVKNV
ncbi:MAG: ferrous iron transport protein A [Candidatus Omnitrophica bacterium]|nr:ferrous iron transport protein A [Candidatus Omnitrophota bacterium]